MNEPLHATHPFPVNRSFVLKLHRDADLAGGELCGRIVHLVSDERSDFVGAAGLLLALRALIAASVPLAVPGGPRLQAPSLHGLSENSP